jgi:hypothetical protein
VTDTHKPRRPIERISVRVCVGEHLLSASDDPLFLGLRGASGREFRLAFAHGKSLRRGGEDLFVFGTPQDSETNVAHAELNDPTAPALDAASIQSVFLRKGFEPIPNVRGFGEMDDRLEILEAAIELHIAGDSEPRHFYRSGPLWLGLVCGLCIEIPPASRAS